MLDSIKDILRDKTKEEKIEHEKMVKHLVKSCLKSTCIVLVLIIAFEMFFFVNSIQHPKSFGSLGIWYRLCYLVLMSASAVSLGIILFCRRNYEKRYKAILWLSPLYSTLITGWSLSVTYLDVLKSQKTSPILFMTIILCLPACMYLNSYFYLFLDLVSSSIMLKILFDNPTGADTADILNFIVFAIIQLVVSMFFLSTRYGYYRSLRQGLLNERKARKATEAKAATLSNMSHELRTPLNAILGMNELIEREDSKGELEEYTESIRTAGDALLGLVNDMLDFSKLEAGKMKVVSSSYRLSEVLSKVYNIMHGLAEKKGLAFRIEVEKNTPDRLEGDAQRIQQLLINLINNAVKYTPKGSVVLRVSVDSEKGILSVEVQDTGIGIKEEDQPYLFDSFSQVDDENNHHIEGTGLGLMICERFVHLMQGEIGVNSQYGEGSCFWFWVPQRILENVPMVTTEWGKDAKGEKETKVRSKPESVLEDAQISSCKLLVVDDTAMNLKVFAKFLEKEPVLVNTAESGEQCLEKIQEEEYDIIFLDHMMPGMDGVETLHRIRLEGPQWCQKVPVIALTANGGVDAREEYVTYGFDDYLAKPISLSALLDIINKYRK